MVTLDDVAARAGGLSHDRVERAPRQGGCAPRNSPQGHRGGRGARLPPQPCGAPAQFRGRTHVIGLTVADFDLIFPAALAAAISDQAQTLGYQVIVQQTRFSHDFEQHILSSATSQICDGTIVCWPSSATAEMETFARAHPLVLLDGVRSGRAMRLRVHSPARTAWAAATRHLVDHGCRRVLMLGGSYLPPEQFANADTSERCRIRGAAEGLLSSGLPYRADDVYPCGWTREAGVPPYAGHPR